MTRKEMDRINLGLGIMRRTGQVLLIVGFVGALGIVGTSDLETELGEILHPSEWYTRMICIYMLITAAGAVLAGIAKPIYRWIRRVNYFYELGMDVYYDSQEDFDDDED